MPKQVIANIEKLLALRKDRRWSRDEYASRAAELGLDNGSPSVIAKAESGKPVSPETIDTAAEVYNVIFDELVLPEFRRGGAVVRSAVPRDQELQRFLARNGVHTAARDSYIELYHSPAWRGWKRNEVVFRYVGAYPTPIELQTLMDRYVPGPPIREYFGLHRCSPHPLGDEAPHLELEAYGGTYHHVYALTQIYTNRHDDPDCARFRKSFEDSWISPNDTWPLASSPLYHNVNAEVIVISADNKIILGRRQKGVGFWPGTYSASLEEQMLRCDPDIPNRGDRHPFDAAERGVREELDATIVPESTRLLSIGIEWGNFTAALIFLIRCAEDFDGVVQRWQEAKHDPYEAIALDCIAATPDGIAEALLAPGWSPSAHLSSRIGQLKTDIGAWHPTARTRLHAIRSHLESLKNN